MGRGFPGHLRSVRSGGVRLRGGRPNVRWQEEGRKLARRLYGELDPDVVAELHTAALQEVVILPLGRESPVDDES